MQTEILQRLRTTSAFLLMLAFGGCASLEPPADTLQGAQALSAAAAAAEAESAREAAVRARSLGEPQYLRFKADETQLARAQDDGRFTYLEFAAPVTAELAFFDQDGRPLTVAGAGRVVAIHGLHSGILVGRADRASFVSPNPRALSLPRRPLPETADYGEARAKLENQGGQLQAMQRALEAAKSNAGAVQSVAPPPAYSTEAEQSSRLRHLTQPSHLPQRPRSFAADLSSSLTLPLAAANASATAPERGLVRVYFATASRAIVAPDDGLGLLLREAGKADEIRVTGFTDATGSRATNEALALARADAVVQILLRRGIAGERIFSSAVGADEYIADNHSEKGRALNRRVEVLLLRNGLPLTFGVAARAMR